MNSCVYIGRVQHARSGLVEHSFSYRHALLALDLDEVERAFDGRWLWSNERANVLSFRRADHVGDPTESLTSSIRELVRERLGRDTRGSILLLTQPRLFGYAFNPVSFYYLRDEHGKLDVIVAEITNTPWNERHCYVLDAKANAHEPTRRFRFGKQFHISPFMDMELEHDWTFSDCGDALSVQMLNRSTGRAFFSADLRMRRFEFGAASLLRVLCTVPLMSFQVVSAIYWQALRLKLKGAPFYEHPRERAARSPARAR